ncbi:IclR family transcriptional regulator [Streptomyces sp. NPDC017546]|uniref:IclR family transcriptional regulator n=1 Tax=unclassified Streptomyces TaxID=2593676 RepID=UPI0023629A10|nr:IclR family transcriptional regulator C-terminal domain-containing protein [Streptomyces sp. MMBL 11-1]
MSTSTPERGLSGVGVLDKASLLLDVVGTGPTSLAGLVALTGLKRPTVHRLALALERLHLLGRDGRGRFVLGSRLGELAGTAWQGQLMARAEPVLVRTRDLTGASVRLYRRVGELQTCVVSAESATDPKPSPRVGTAFPMKSGSVSQVLLAWERADRLSRALRGARFSATTLANVRRKGWAQSAEGASPGMISVSAPVRDVENNVIAAVSLSGPLGQLSSNPGPRYSKVVLHAAAQLSGLG